MKRIFTAVLPLFIGLVAAAQDAETLKTQFVADWERAKAYTIEYMDAMPAGQYNFKPQDSVRSFARQLLHLAQGNIGLVANGTGAERIWANQNLESRESAQSADSTRYLVNASYDYAINAIKGMDASKLFEKFKRGSFDLTRYAWLLKSFEHQTHHRGQLTIYLRTAGIKPPNERLF